MNVRTIVCSMSVVALALVAGIQAEGNNYSPRQYYSSWQYHSPGGYHYRTYYYRPTPTYVGYRYHYVVYRPSTPRYVYYYNPYSRSYWGRYDLEAACSHEAYSELAPQDRRANLNEIPEKAFPRPAAMPRVPEAEDAAVMQGPPSDLPRTDALPK